VGRGRGYNFKSPLKSLKPKFKKKHTFVGTTILNVLCDLPFRRNQP